MLKGIFSTEPLTGTTLDDRLSLEIYYNGEFRGNYSDHSYGGQLFKVF